ncbi:MAG: glycosyltransferase [Gammaproteobacteria bacterium]|jgi:glycosyltransferase involved in cell wall biosynthesis
MTDFDIVIATYNSEATLGRCLDSVRAIAGAAACRVVLIDGASGDGTLEVAAGYRDIVDVVVSEPDSGVYDAWNKGLEHCAAKWVMFLGSDDYLRPGVFPDYLDFIDGQTELDFISCRVSYVDAAGREIRTVGRPWQWPAFKKYMCALHPGSFTALDYIRRVGRFDESLKICGDYELLLRAGPDLRTAHWPGAPICMQVGGLSDGLRVLGETYTVKVRSGHRGRVLSTLDYGVGLAKYLTRTYVMGSR